jgi:K+:H+ antiporter
MKDFLFTLAVLLVVAKVCGELARRFHQPAVLGELIAGLLLGPSLFGRIAPEFQAEMFGPSETLPRLTTLSICFLLAVTGLEIDLPLIGRRARAAIWLSGGGLILPLILGFVWGWWLPLELRGDKDQFLVASFAAVALAISAIPVVAKVLMDLGALRSNLGQLILAAAMIDDAVGWILLSMVAGLASHGGYIGTETLIVMVVTVLTLGLSLTWGPRWMGRLVAWSDRKDPSSRAQLSLFVICLVAAATFTEWIGLEPGFGAFLLGVVAGQSRRFSHRVLHTVELVTVAFFSPLFFATAGLKVDLLAILHYPVWLYTLVLILIASISKFAGCYLGGMKAGLAPLERLLVGAGMNPRGAMGVIVATLGLKLEVINLELYSMLVTMALLTSIAAPPILRMLLAKLGNLGQDEVKTFAGQLKRILIPTAGGDNTKFAAKMFSTVSTRQELEVTTLRVGEDCSGTQLLTSGSNLHVQNLTRKISGSIEETVLDEAHLGYELLVIGAGRVEGLIDRILQAAPCPTLVVRAPKVEDEKFSIDSILLPVVGSQHSRRAVEIGAWWAKAYDAKITLLHVIPPVGEEELLLAESHHRHRHDFATRLLDGFAEELRHDGLLVDTLVVEHVWPEKAIVECLNERHSLVIMATNLMPLSGRAFLGHCVEHVLEHAEPAVIALSMP